MGGRDRAKGPEAAEMLGLRGGGCWRALRGCRNLKDRKEDSKSYLEIQSTSPKSNYRLSQIFLTVPICSVYFQWYVFLISRNCNLNFAYLEYILEPQGDQRVLNHSPKSKWPQLSFLTDFIRLTCNPCLSAWPKRCHKFPHFLSAFLISPMHYTVMILSAFISLYLYPKHTNVYKNETQILSRSKWFARSTEIRLRRSWLYVTVPFQFTEDIIIIHIPDFLV